MQKLDPFDKAESVTIAVRIPGKMWAWIKALVPPKNRAQFYRDAIQSELLTLEVTRGRKLEKRRKK